MRPLVASTFTGAGIVVAAATIFLTMTPLGWVAIIVTTAGLSLLANDAGKEVGDRLYDRVKRLMDH